MKNIDSILKIVLGTLNGGQKNEILSRLDQDPQAKEEFRKIKNAWALAASKKVMPDYDVEQLYLNFRKQVAKKPGSRRLPVSGLLKYAAVFILAVAISSLFFYFQHNRFNALGKIDYTTAIAGYGQVSKIILPDSSVVWLNSGSQIKYNNNYARDNREIYLTGQAYFQVARNEAVPMRVFCDNLEIKVLGTRFDLSAYPEDENISLFLESGKVEMRDLALKSVCCELKPGEIAQYNKSTEDLSFPKVTADKFVSWKEGILIFRDDPMADVIPKLERRYDIEIKVSCPEIYQSIFTATIKNETLEEIFKSISFACSINYKILKGDSLDAKTKIILTK
ncbi:FecR family protein [Gaoshiqia sp. Z1-71]|uniref:FecR family protein n=1 Tax=Gaoshiqia hydrogeniformans TaxID=3290090 RepID=UPI003BF8E13C